MQRTYSQDEIDDLHLLDWEEFSEKYSDRTHDAYMIKRRRTRDELIPVSVGAVPLVGSPSITIRDPANEDAWEDLFASLEKADGVRSQLIPSQETAEFISPEQLPIGVCFLGDIHAGGSGVLYEQLRRDLETIRDTEGLYVCGMGDYLDNYKPQAKSGTGTYHSLFASPTEQLAYVTTRLRIAQGKWLCLAQGNHDAWDGKWAGIDRLPALANDLGAPYFSERGGTLMMHVGKTRYVVIVKHDYRGRSQINKSASQGRLFDNWPEWTNADVICLAHLHEPDMHQTMRKGQTVTYLRSGTYKIHDEWAESAGYKPSYGVPMVVLYPGTRKIVAFSGENFEEAVQFLQQARERFSPSSLDYKLHVTA